MEVKYQAGAFKLTIRGVGGLFALLYIPFLKLFHNPSSITKVLSFVSFSLSKVLKFSLLTCFGFYNMFTWFSCNFSTFFKSLKFIDYRMLEIIDSDSLYDSFKLWT